MLALGSGYGGFEGRLPLDWVIGGLGDWVIEGLSDWVIAGGCGRLAAGVRLGSRNG